MPTGRLLLSGAKGADVAVGGSALRALDPLAVIADAAVHATATGRGVEAPLVEAVLAEEMHRRQVQRGPARGASTRLEHCRATPECGELVAFGFGFGSIRFRETAVLFFLKSINENNGRD